MYFSPALIPALQLITRGSLLASHISTTSLNSESAHCHGLPFSHAPIPSSGSNHHLWKPAKQRQNPLPLLTLLARADPSAVAITSGSNVASRISLSKPIIYCHCMFFSHALIPAL
ncbi:unnamed protein product [Prorocentrum cordatum]|uniref:Uncharacterized protein n=1 Tax=Prorocentrum cordatum TaxID=2364126 RepID=A0ABN9PJW6_9DINO|nr:unnamed protein product [Polarella glacialis]